MTNRSILSRIKSFLVLVSLFCAFFSSAQDYVDLLYSPVSTIDGTQARVSAIGVMGGLMGDSPIHEMTMVLAEVEVIPSSDMLCLSSGISPETVLVVDGKIYPLSQAVVRKHDSQFYDSGKDSWSDVKADNAYYLMLSFIAEGLSDVESISILPSEECDSNNASASYFSFPDIKIKSSGFQKALAAKTLKGTKLLSGPSSKAKKLQKLSKGAEVFIIEDDLLNDSSSKFCKVLVVSSGITGYVEKKAVGQDGNSIDLMVNTVKLSKKGATNANPNSQVAEIKCHNRTRIPATITINKTKVTIDPDQTETFKVNLKEDGLQDGQTRYMIVTSEGFPMMIIPCNLTAGDTYFFDFIRPTEIMNSVYGD